MKKALEMLCKKGIIIKLEEDGEVLFQYKEPYLLRGSRLPQLRDPLENLAESVAEEITNREEKI